MPQVGMIIEGSCRRCINTSAFFNLCPTAGQGFWVKENLTQSALMEVDKTKKINEVRQVRS